MSETVLGKTPTLQAEGRMGHKTSMSCSWFVYLTSAHICRPACNILHTSQRLTAQAYLVTPGRRARELHY